MAVRILTDSGSDISQATAEEWGIRVLPMTIRFGEEEYLDGVNLSPNEFYEKLIETDELPKTSQIPPYYFEQEFKDAKEHGDEVICFCVSSKLSGTYQSACIAQMDYEDCVTVIDTRQVCFSQYIIVERAVSLREQGFTRQQIAEKITEELNDVHIIAAVDTLEYLKLGGRLSAAAAMAGTLLAIKPVITIEDGIVKILGKAKGSRKSRNMLTEMVMKYGGIDFDKPICIGHSGTNDDMLRKYAEDSKVLYEGHEDCLQYAQVGAAIGTHAGPGAIAVGFFAKNQ